MRFAKTVLGKTEDHIPDLVAEKFTHLVGHRVEVKSFTVLLQFIPFVLVAHHFA